MENILHDPHIYRQFLRFPYSYWLSKKIIRRNRLKAFFLLKRKQPEPLIALAKNEKGPGKAHPGV
jgi:hypothetical protein